MNIYKNNIYSYEELIYLFFSSIYKFFEGFNWGDIENIKNETIREYVKQRTNENNQIIKQRMLKEKNNNNNKDKDEFKTEDGYPLMIEINLTESEEKYFS